MELPFGLGLTTGVLMAGVLFIAAFVRGYSGFGFSALVIASAALLSNPIPWIPVVIVLELAMTVGQARGLRPLVEWRRVVWMLTGAVVAMPVALLLLVRSGADPARLAISLGILVICVLLLSGWKLRRKIGAVGHFGVGLVSGIANGAAVGGLPVAAFMTAQPMRPPVFRATMVAYLTAIDLVALPLLWFHGLLKLETFVVALLALFVVLPGLWLGGQRFAGTAPKDFRRSTIAVLSVLALLGVVKSVM